MIVVSATRVDHDSFAPFGTVVLAPAGRPTSEGPTYRFWSDLAHYDCGGETEIGVCAVSGSPSIEFRSLERHLHTPEILVPIDAPFALPLMVEGTDEPKAFIVNIGEAVVIDRAVWHGACVPIGVARSSYFVIFRRGTPHNDVEHRDVTPFTLRFPGEKN
jgi:ureidoglycolate hydrolase